MQLLRHVLGTAVPKYLDVNPAAGVQTPRRRNFEARILTRDEEAARLACATVEEAPWCCARSIPCNA